MRIKYLMSNFTQVSFRDLDDKLLKMLLPAGVYKYTVEIVKGRLAYFVTYGSGTTTTTASSEAGRAKSH